MSKARQELGCPHCGESVKVEWDFCPKCGAEIYLPVYPVTSEVIIEDRPHKPEFPIHIPNFLRLAKSEKISVPNDKKINRG
jgi:ribosomal protein S27AE